MVHMVPSSRVKSTAMFENNSTGIISTGMSDRVNIQAKTQYPPTPPPYFSPSIHVREPEENGERHRRKSGRCDQTDGMDTVYSCARRRKRHVNGYGHPSGLTVSVNLCTTPGVRKDTFYGRKSRTRTFNPKQLHILGITLWRLAMTANFGDGAQSPEDRWMIKKCVRVD